MRQCRQGANASSYGFRLQFVLFGVNIVEQSCVGDNDNGQRNKVIERHRVDTEIELHVTFAAQATLGIVMGRINNTVAVVEWRSEDARS